ncbi:MAG: dihydrofolate reductase, partial [Bacteroidales bacterium]
ESLPNGALPNRKNIVISRNADLSFPNTVMTASLQEALQQAGPDKEVFIIGGASIYEAALPIADRMYLTFIHHRFDEADTFFPQWNESEWKEIAREAHTADEKNRFDYTFVTLERIDR